MASFTLVTLMSLLIGALPAITGLTASNQAPEPFDAFSEFRTVCLDWDGDLEAAQEFAEHRGYEAAQDRIDAFRPLGTRVRYTYAWAKQVGDQDVQILITPRTGVFQNGVLAAFDRCSIATTPDNRRSLYNAVAHHLRQDSFRMRDTSVFAWTTHGDQRRPVRRKIFERVSLNTLATNRGMKMITVADHGDQVILSYFVPSRRDCRVLQTYSTTEPNIQCGFDD